MNFTDVTIIGGGPVGLFGAFYAGLRGMSVRIVDSLPELGGQLTALYPEKYVYDMPGFPKVLAKTLAREMIAQGTQFSPEISLQETAEVLEVVEGGYLIRTARGTEFLTRTIIIAAGAGAFTPTKIGAVNEEEFVDKGVCYGVRDKSAFAGKQVAIVGGGDSAFDWCWELHDIAESVSLIHRRDQFRAHEETVAKVQSTGVNFVLWTQVKEIHGNGHVQRLVLENSQTKESSELATDAVIVNIGFKSSLGPIKDWGLNIEKNQIQVDHLYETNLPGIFAVGDVCNFEGKLKLIATGVGEAATAVCIAKTRLDPSAKLFPGHSSDRDA